MAVLAGSSVPLTRHRKNEAREFRLIFAVCFAVFLVAALVARLLAPFGARAAGPRRSIIDEARTAAQTSLPFAFMG
jgi:hypothetical protein